MAAHSHNPNPAVSPEQYRLAQAVLSGTVRGPVRMTKKVARELVERTPAHLRSEWSRHTAENPFYGADLDLETSMAPAWKYYDSKAARDAHARLKEGEGKKVVLGHSMFGFNEGGGKKWRMRLADHRGNPKKRPTDVDGNPVPQNYEILSIRRNQGDALDVKKGLALENIPAVIVEPPSTTFGTSTGNWSVWTPRKTYKRAVKLAEKAYFERYPERLKQNPQSSSDDMYESFHGEPTDETIEFQNEEHYHSHLAAIGELVELKVKLVNGGTAVIGFEDNSGAGEERSNPDATAHFKIKGLPKDSDYNRLPFGRQIEYRHAIQAFKDSAQHGYADSKRRSYTIALKDFLKMHGATQWYALTRGKTGDYYHDDSFEVWYTSGEKQNPFWPFNSFTHTTIYHVGTGEKYKAAGTHKGYTLYRKLDTDEFLVPALDKDSRFDTLKDAKAFVDSWTKHAKNPGGPLDTHAAKELELFVENDADLYRQQYSPINKNLITKMARGVYNHAGAVKLFGYLMEFGAKKYAKEYSEGKDWHQIFSPATRKHVAELFADHFETEAKLGNYNNLLPKKYAGWKPNPGPFHEAGKLFRKGTHAARRPVDQFLGTAGKVGGYLDDELGRVLNPKSQVDKNGFSEAHIAGQRWLWARLKTAKGSFSTVPGAEAYLKKLGLESTRHMSAAYQPESVKERIARAQQIYTDFIDGADYAFNKHYQNRHPSSENPRNTSDHDTGPAYLTSNESGTQLFITGGDQSLDLPGLGITGPQAEKELVTIGQVTNIVYHTRKIFSGKEEEYDYTHKLSEDTHGPLPVLIYDRINEHLKLSGGEYKIERPLVGTSPGIEN